MAVSKDQVLDWCNQLLADSTGFPPLEKNLEMIPDLETLADLPAGTRVLVRGDTDVKVGEGGKIKDDVRLRSLIETLKFGIERGWVQILYGHAGRKPDTPSLDAVGKHMQKLLEGAGVTGAKVDFTGAWMDDATGEVLDSAVDHVAKLPNGTVTVLENTRFYDLEQVLWKATPETLPGFADRITNYANGVRKLAAVHVNEGFASSNMDLSSTVVPLTMDRVALGKYIGGELRKYVTRTRQAELVVFSGMKLEKLDDLEQILNRGQVRMVIAAGLLAIALKKADQPDFEIGLGADPSQKKLYIPPERIEQAKRMLSIGRKNGVEFVLPVDFVLGDKSESETIPKDGAQFDVGSKTAALHEQKVSDFIGFSKKKEAAGKGPAVAFHNGVFGMFEKEEFSHGTRKFMHQLKRMHENGVEVYVGGGEGGLALEKYGDESWVTHSFTAGGTILKALGNEPIPYLKALTMKCRGA